MTNLEHRSTFLKKIKDSDHELRKKINQGRQDLYNEVRIIFQFVESLISAQAQERTKIIFDIVSRSYQNGNKLLVDALREEFIDHLGIKEQLQWPAWAIKLGDDLVSECGASQALSLKWAGDLGDDCTATVGNYVLRAEAMDENDWWWKVYGIGHDEDDQASSHHVRGRFTTGAQARRAAERELWKYISSENGQPFGSADALGLVWIEGRLRVVSLSVDDHYQFADNESNLHRIFFQKTFSRQLINYAISEFEDLINRATVRELELQRFFERYPDFIISDDYKTVHSQIVLSSQERDNLIPDFILEPHDPDGLCDLLELKLPKQRIVTFMRNRTAYSAAVHQAKAQLREYEHYFDERKNRESIIRRYGLNIYKPRMLLIIGRKPTVDPLLMRRMERDLPNITIKTYDDILLRMRVRNI